VPERDAVLFHAGNTIDDTKGCILIGEEFGGTIEEPRLESSQRGFKGFLGFLAEDQEFDLIVHDVMVRELVMQV
jgi:hypothetical protein